jgi:hypothetical protein
MQNSTPQRDFQNVKTGASFRVASDIQYIPPLRRAIATKLNDAQWEDDNVYKHDAGLDTKLNGFCPELTVEELPIGRPKTL